MISNMRKALLGLAAVASVGAMAAPAQAQWRHGGYHGGYYGHRHGGWNAGGAAAAGVIGGLALGALATRPAYGYGYGYAAPAYGYGGCYIERQRVYDAWGRPFIRRVRVCD